MSSFALPPRNSSLTDWTNHRQLENDACNNSPSPQLLFLHYNPNLNFRVPLVSSSCRPKIFTLNGWMEHQQPNRLSCCFIFNIKSQGSITSTTEEEEETQRSLWSVDQMMRANAQTHRHIYPQSNRKYCVCATSGDHLCLAISSVCNFSLKLQFELHCKWRLFCLWSQYYFRLWCLVWAMTSLFGLIWA